jgi:hypothetical protein
MIEFLMTALEGWGRDDDRVLAIGIVGSYARGTARADSDVDVVVICTQPDVMLSEDLLLERFGKLQRAQSEDYGLVQSRRCWYANGLEIEFGFTSTRWCTPPIDQATGAVIKAGLASAYDPQQLLALAQRWINDNTQR